MYKMTIQVPGGTMEVPGDSLEAVIKAASFLQNLPFVCPVDGTPTRLSYRKAGGYDYYGLVSTGAAVYTYPFGRPLEKGDGEFFEGKVVKQGKETSTRRQWCYYDHDKQEQIVLWEDGRLTAEGRKRQTAGSPVYVGREEGEPVVTGLPPWDGGTDGAESDKLVDYANGDLQGVPLKPAGYISPVIELRKTVSLLGNELYADKWFEVARHNVERLTSGKYHELEDLTAEELTRLIAGLNRLKNRVVA